MGPPAGGSQSARDPDHRPGPRSTDRWAGVVAPVREHRDGAEAASPVAIKVTGRFAPQRLSTRTAATAGSRSARNAYRRRTAGPDLSHRRHPLIRPLESTG